MPRATSSTATFLWAVQTVSSHYAAIVGSSNFTGAGSHHQQGAQPLPQDGPLAEEEMLRIGPAPVDGREEMELRRELMSGVGAQAITELDRWFRERWEESRDFKEELIELLDASKFGQLEYTPYQVYMKALFEYFKDDLGTTEAAPGKSAWSCPSSRRTRSRRPAGSLPATTGS